jgi:hypothetical protein
MALRMLLVLALSLSSCGYSLKFVCSSPGTADCPSGQACPVVAKGPNACGDLPGLFGNATIPQTSGHPLGCTAFLPYGNPSYGSSQVACTCTMLPTPDWVCPI